MQHAPARKSSSPARSGWFFYLSPWLAYAVLAAAILLTRGIISKGQTHDLYVVFDQIWRVFSGEQAFVDFHSPLGMAYSLPYLLLRHLEPFSLLTMFHGNLLVGLALLILASVTLPHRLPPGLYFWAAFSMVAVAISPRFADHSIKAFSHLAPYNRWCEATTMLAAPLLLLAKCTPGKVIRWNSKIDWVDGMALALLALFVFHIKISYFLCIVGLAATGLVFQRLSVGTALFAGVLFAVCSGVLELTLHLHRPYLADLNQAVAATIEVYGRVRLQNTITGPLMAAAYFFGAVALVWQLAPVSVGQSPLRGRWPLLLLLAAGLMLAMLTHLQNHPQNEVPLMGTVLLVGIASMRGNGRLADLSVGRKVTCIAIFLAGVAAIPLTEASAVLLHAVQSRTQSVCPLPALRGTVGEQLLFTRYSLRMPADARCSDFVIDEAAIRSLSDDQLTNEEAHLEVARLTDAFNLLKGRPASNQAVLALDFANPYPALTGSRSPHGAMLWWDMGRNYSPGSRPDPGPIFDSVDYVLQSKLDPPMVYERHGENAWKVYGAEVTQGFTPIGEGRLWRLWERKPGGQGGPGPNSSGSANQR